MFSRVLESELILIALYVDDLLISSSYLELMHQVKDVLALQFSMEDLDQASHCLRIKNECSKEKGIVTLSQADAIERALKNSI